MPHLKTFKKVFLLRFSHHAFLTSLFLLILPLMTRAAVDPNLIKPDDTLPSAYCEADAGSILPKCTRCGDCELEDFVEMFVRLSTVMLGLLSAVALLMMVMSGFTIATSGGNPEKLESGKKAMQQTLIGAGLVLVAWLIINTLILIVSGQNPADSIGQLFDDGRKWYQIKK